MLSTTFSNKNSFALQWNPLINDIKLINLLTNKKKHGENKNSKKKTNMCNFAYANEMDACLTKYIHTYIYDFKI